MNRTPERKLRSGLKDRTPTGTWRERFRKGCLDRLKDKRHKLVNNFRNANDENSPQSSQEFVSQLMADEWEKMKLESPLLRNLPQCKRRKEHFEFDDSDDDDEDDNSQHIDEILNVFEEIQNELLREEQRILTEYEDVVTFDEEYLCAAIDLLSTDAVTCPVCKKNNLLQHDRIIFCKCGIRINTEQDAMTLKHVKTMLDESIKTHRYIYHSANPTRKAIFKMLFQGIFPDVLKHVFPFESSHITKVESTFFQCKYLGKTVDSPLTEQSMLSGAVCSHEPDFGVVDLTGADMVSLIMTCNVCDCMSIII